VTKPIVQTVEMHCHNVYSNGPDRASKRFPVDNLLTVQEQMQAAYLIGLDALFITNHNTLDGYMQMLEYQKDHPKYSGIKIYPGIELTVRLPSGREGHMLGYGVNQELKRGLDVAEARYRLKSQGAVVAAPHPFAVTAGIGKWAEICDLVESFNSNNVDIYSNVTAAKFARDERKLGFAGSDAHVPNSIGNCYNEVMSDSDDLEDVLKALSRGMFKVGMVKYNTVDDLAQHFFDQTSDMRSYLKHTGENKGVILREAARVAIKTFRTTYSAPIVNYLGRWLWKKAGNFALGGTRKLSERVHVNKEDEGLIYGPWRRRIVESIKKVKRVDNGTRMFIDEYEAFGPITMINKTNDEIKRGT
jgi:predicted metal-dependent phosphoesterase TrpH